MSPHHRHFLRHSLATLAYRGGKAIRDIPASFPAFRVSDSSRTPLEILTHIGDLLEWMHSLLRGHHEYREAPPDSWEAQSARFYAELESLDRLFASPEDLPADPLRVFDGPVADALTHIGQINLLRRVAGSPVRGENYFKASIETGRVGNSQPPAIREFD